MIPQVEHCVNSLNAFSRLCSVLQVDPLDWIPSLFSPSRRRADERRYTNANLGLGLRPYHHSHISQMDKRRFSRTYCLLERPPWLSSFDYQIRRRSTRLRCFATSSHSYASLTSPLDRLLTLSFASIFSCRTSVEKREGTVVSVQIHKKPSRWKASVISLPIRLKLS